MLVASAYLGIVILEEQKDGKFLHTSVLSGVEHVHVCALLSEEVSGHFASTHETENYRHVPPSLGTRRTVGTEARE